MGEFAYCAFAWVLLAVAFLLTAPATTRVQKDGDRIRAPLVALVALILGTAAACAWLAPWSRRACGLWAACLALLVLPLPAWLAWRDDRTPQGRRLGCGRWTCTHETADPGTVEKQIFSPGSKLRKGERLVTLPMVLGNMRRRKRELRDAQRHAELSRSHPDVFAKTWGVDEGKLSYKQEILFPARGRDTEETCERARKISRERFPLRRFGDCVPANVRANRQGELRISDFQTRGLGP